MSKRPFENTPHPVHLSMNRPSPTRDKGQNAEKFPLATLCAKPPKAEIGDEGITVEHSNGL